MNYSYKTIDHISEGLFKDRGSKFISIAYPVNSENEIKNILIEIQKKYHDARHHCYAWRLGINPITARSNDDGEPSNSAGKPILNQLEKYNLTNILLIVVRYFGGTLLGVGGLINAYRSAAEAAILGNNIVKKHLSITYMVKFEYPKMNDVMGMIKEHHLEPFEQVFEISCSLKFRVRLIDNEKILSKLEAMKDITFEIV